MLSSLAKNKVGQKIVRNEDIPCGTYGHLIKRYNGVSTASSVIGTVNVTVSETETSFSVSFNTECIKGMTLSELNGCFKKTFMPLRWRYGITLYKNGSKERRDGVYQEFIFI